MKNLEIKFPVDNEKKKFIEDIITKLNNIILLEGGFKEYFFRVEKNFDDVVIKILYGKSCDLLLTWHVYLQSRLDDFIDKYPYEGKNDNRFLLVVEHKDLWK